MSERPEARRGGRGTALAALVLILGFSGLSAPSATAASGAGVAHRVSAAETRLAQAFWTSRRMLSAEPRRMTPPRLPARSGARSARPSRAARGAPTVVPARPPARRPRGLRSLIVDDPTVDPFSTHGRIFGRYRGRKFSCSGTVINTPSNRAVLTAGHCLREAGVWSTDVVFVPAYDRGRRPFGNFHAKTLWVLRGWLNENVNYDVGIISVRANSRGKPGKVVGARGWATGLGRNQLFEAFGYPAGAAQGRQLRYCDSPYLGDDPSTYREPGPPTMRIDCNMAGGSSGGGWIVDDELANSVISYGYTSRRDRLYGPYFGRAVKRLIRRAGG